MSFLNSLDDLGRLSAMGYSEQGSFETAMNFGIATVADIGTSLWSSVTFGKAEISTTALLQSLGADGAIDTYHKYQDSIELASFVGGALIPGFAAVKLTKAIRDGNKAFYAFSSARKSEDLRRISTLISEGKKGSAEYRKLRNSTILKAQANNLADTAAAELAVMGAMSAHPFMEDYMEDPLKNFGIGMAIGGGLTAPFTAIGSRAALRQAHAAVDVEARSAILGAADMFDIPVADTSSLLNTLDRAASNIENLAGKSTTNEYTRQLATDMAALMRGGVEKLVDGKIPEKLDNESRRYLMGLMTDPQFLGVDRAKFYQPPKRGFLNKANPFSKSERPTFKTVVDDVTEFEGTHYFSPEHGSFIGKEVVEDIASAADVATPATIAKRAKEFVAKELRKASDPEFLSSAQLEAEHLARIMFYDGLPTGALADVRIVGNDMPAVNGWLSAINSRHKRLTEEASKLDLADPAGIKRHQEITEELTELSKSKITISEGELEKTVPIKELAELPVTGTGVSEASTVRDSHFAELDGLFSRYSSKTRINGADVEAIPALVNWYDGRGASFKDISTVVHSLGLLRKDWVGNSANWYNDIAAKVSKPPAQKAIDQAFPKGQSADDLSYEAKAVLLMMIAADEPAKVALRSAMESARTLRSGLDSNIPFHKEWAEIINHPLAKRQREAMLKHVASSDGHVYLYRGISGDPVGQTAVASYSWNKRVSKGFAHDTTDASGKVIAKGKLTLNQISVNDVVGFLYHGESEFLVAASTRQDLAGVITDYVGPQADKAKKLAKAQMPNQVTMDYAQATKFYQTTVADRLQEAINRGVSIEVAALRNNMRLDEAEALMANFAHSKAAIDKGADAVIGEGFALSRWQSVEAIPEALAMERRIVEATAQKRHHVGEAGDILDKQRAAIADHRKLTADEKAALNAGDTAAAENIRTKINMMDNLFGNIHKEWVDLTMTTSESKLAQGLMQHVIDHDLTKLLREGLSTVSNAVGGNSLFQSADFVMRQMGEFGRIVAHLGDARGGVVNRLTQELLTPVATNLRALGSNAVARTEFAMLDQFRHSTPGTLYWDSAKGRFYTELVEEGMEITTHVGPSTQNPLVLKAMDSLVEASNEVSAARRTKARLGNGVAPPDLGFWSPSTKLVGKEYAYVLNDSTHEATLLIANSVDELNALKQAYKLNKGERIISRTNLELENMANLDDGRIRRVTMADVSKTKKGITDVAPDISAERLEDIISGYVSQFNQLSTGMLKEAYHDVLTKLDHFSSINAQAWKDTGKTGWRKAKAQLGHKDVAGDVKDYLLGRNPTQRSEFVGGLNAISDTIIFTAAQAMTSAWKMVKPERLGDPIAYDKYVDALKAAGIENPFLVFAEADRAALFAKARDGSYAGDPQRIVNAFNALASTTALKFLEVAQPLVNILSLPILMSSSISRMIDLPNAHAGTFFENSQMAIMMSGVRRTWSKDPRNRRLFQMAKDEGMLQNVVSEADAALSTTRLHTDKGALSKLERGLQSSLVNILSAPSDWAESLVRNVTMGTAIDLALRNLGPAATDKQILIFARDFMKQAIGNYSAAQRPAMFQGSFGAAMGLFQTYMVTYAQNMYSHIELKDRKGLAKMMLAQGGIFGAYSIPGWNPISQAIGEHFSDEHFDLTTGLYRALPDRLAATLVYGMPSNMLGALHTRGDVSPRIPTSFFEFVAPSIVGQYAETVVDLAKGMSRFDETAGRAMLEALSVQSASRPIARLSELMTGTAVTKAGIQVAGPEEVWSFQGIMARVLSTRTLSEATAREVIHLNTVYGQQDRANRQAVIKNLRQDLRSSTLSHKRLDDYAYEYLRTGSPQGWRAAVNEAVLANENRGVIDLTAKLKDSPLTLLLENIDL